MKASLRLSLLVILFLGLMPSSCFLGNCDDPIPYKIDLKEIYLTYFVDRQRWDIQNPVDSKKEFLLSVGISGDEIFVMKTLPEIPAFGQLLMATKDCPPDYFDGFKVAVDSFDLYSDTSFFGQAAGTSLIPFFDVEYDHRNSWPDHPMTVPFSAFNDTVRLNPDKLWRTWSQEAFFIKVKSPIPKGNYRFTVTMLLKNGTLISKETELITFN